MQKGHCHGRGLGLMGRVGLLTLFILALFLPYPPPIPAQAAPPVAVIPVTTPEGKRLWVEVATTPQQRARGLMFRDHLPQDMGMLFIFPAPRHWTIWMKNTRIPLDILWLDRSKTIVHIEPNVPRCDLPETRCPQYRPKTTASFVLELAAGRASTLHLIQGVTLDIPLRAGNPRAK